MIDKLKKDLSFNYHESDDEVLENLVTHYTSIASDTSNRKIDDKLLEPYVYEAVKEAFLRRGDEGTSSSSEGGQSASYIDIEEKLRKDVLAIRLINC